MRRIRVQGDRFVDDFGRHVILHGVNMVYKGSRVNGRMDYYPKWGEEDFRRLHDWGFNVIRLGLIWDAVEPHPGQYNEEYLAWVGRMLDLCQEYHIYAVLDMHQDLYSVLYSDGAPEWATLTGGKPHDPGELWSDAYLFSEAVQAAFDNFWANAPVRGKGLQEWYRDMWLHVVRQFKGHPALLGYDFLNEPFPGSSARQIMAALLSRFAELSSEDMFELFSDGEKKLEALALLENHEVYSAVAEAAAPLVAAFEQEELAGFYNSITQAVRSIDPEAIIFREHCYFSNMGIECRVPLIESEPGIADAYQAYSPHGYDLVVDTAAVQQASNKRIDFIFAAHRRTQERLHIPVLVGEWGGHEHYSDGLQHIEHILGIFAANLWSSTYWCYDDSFYKAPVLDVLKRPYPQAVCGSLLAWNYDHENRAFTMEWDEEGSEPSLVYVSSRDFEVELDGPYVVEHRITSALLSVPPIGGRRTLRLKMVSRGREE